MADLDQKALEAAKCWFNAEFNGQPDTDTLTTGIVRAYLSALPADGLVERLEYMVGNPSAWGAYDDGASELIREAAQALRTRNGVGVKKLVWTEPAPPTKGVSYYDHCSTETPIGQYRIEWKSWKEGDAFCVYGPCDFFHSDRSLEEAKAAAQADFDLRILSALSKEDGK